MLEGDLVMALMGLGAASIPALIGRNGVVRYQRLSALEAHWAAWAAKHQYRVEPMRRSWVMPMPARVLGPLKGGTWVLDTMRLDPRQMPLSEAAPDFAPREYTVIAGRSTRARYSMAVISNRKLYQARKTPVGYREMEHHDRDFAALCNVTVAGGSRVEGIEHPRTREALVNLGARPFVAILMNESVWIRWPGHETDEATLDAAVQALVGLCQG